MQKNRRLGIFIGLSLLVFSSLACSFSSLIPGTGGGSTVSDLWEDVPKMSGMVLLKEDMPVEVSLILQTLFAAASDNQGTFTFIAYTTSHTPGDVVNFYNADRMKSSGWDSADQAGCIGSGSSTTTQGGFCMFAKETGANSGTMLAIVPSQDTTTKKTTIFFARIELKNIKTATPRP